MSATVTRLAIAPVKGMRVSAPDALDIGPSGPAGDRAFLVVDDENGLLLSTRTPALLQVAAGWDGDTLALTFPGGRVVAAAPELGAPGRDRELRGTPHLRAARGGRARRRAVRSPAAPGAVLARDPQDRGADDAPVTLMSEASLSALGVPDGRRFRMTITIDGIDAWEEHGWGGRELAAGDAVLRVTEPVPRCVVTTRQPDSGRRDAPTLKRLAELRGKGDVTFGVWCEVVAPGRVRVGDQLAIAT